jgi:hypothetical protein
MTFAGSTRARTALRVPLLVALLVALLALLGCGPGTGGTGLPPGGSGTPPETAAALNAPAVQAPAADPAPRLPPATPADLEGPVDAIDAQAVTVAGVVLPRASLDTVGPDGRAAETPLAVGVSVRAWRLGERWLLVLPSS